MLGWTDCGMAAHYTKKANRARLAAHAMALLAREQTADLYSRTLESGAGTGADCERHLNNLQNRWRPRQGSNLRPAA